ncbi:MAG: CHAP domain-containing protein [Micrococcales bacterium]|nr:CHAP domain-containing protein [Micrococcales bacterium]
MSPQTGLVGADAIGLRDLAQQFSNEATELASACSAVTSRLGDTFWVGPQAFAFRSAWSCDHSSAINTAVERLREKASRLLKDAEEQEAASASTSTITRPTVRQIPANKAGDPRFYLDDKPSDGWVGDPRFYLDGKPSDGWVGDPRLYEDFATPTPESPKKPLLPRWTGRIGGVPRDGKAMGGDDYPYRGRSGFITEFGYYAGNCVDFVAWRLNVQAGITSPPWQFKGFGNAVQWIQGHENVADRTPALGSVAYWNRSELGHVAIVSEVHADGTIVTEEYNWGRDYSYHTRTLRPGDAQYPDCFLHIHDIEVEGFH